MSAECLFSKLSDDVVLNIFFKLEDDPRHWGRLACVSPKFSSLIRTVCCKSRASQTISAVVNDLLSGSSSPPPNYWSSLYKISVCCPGLLHAGVLLENSDFGFERELGQDENFHVSTRLPDQNRIEPPVSSNGSLENPGLNVSGDCCWSLFDDLMFDTVYDTSETPAAAAGTMPDVDFQSEEDRVKASTDSPVPLKRMRYSRSLRSHLASGVWTLSREEGNKLLASRFKGDCLYICDWPGCLHIEEKRNYMLFRGIFKDFKQSRVWRTINDGCRSKIDLNCAFCSCKETYDLHSAFCLRRYFGYHDDGEPVIRAYVCENGHVSGAWTDWPLYT